MEIEFSLPRRLPLTVHGAGNAITQSLPMKVASGGTLIGNAINRVPASSANRTSLSTTNS